MDETSGDAFDQGLLASQRIVVVWFTLIRGRKDLETQATRNPMRILVRACKEKTVRRQGSKRRSVNCGIALGLAFRHSRHRTHGRVSPLTRWPSGLRRCVQVAVRKGAGSNPARVKPFWAEGGSEGPPRVPGSTGTEGYRKDVVGGADCAAPEKRS